MKEQAKKYLPLFLCGLFCTSLSLSAQLRPQLRTVWSSSQQFVVHGWESPLPSVTFLNSQGSGEYLLLEPATLAVSAERIKFALLRALDLKDQWKSKIKLQIHLAQRPGEQPVLVTDAYLRSLEFKLMLPSEIRPSHLVDTVVRALLLERMHQLHPEGGIELPEWMVLGLSELLQADILAGQFAVEAPDRQGGGLRLTSKHAEIVQTDPYARLRKMMQSHLAPTLAELTFDSRLFHSPERGAEARHAAHLLVDSLLKLPSGREKFNAMMTQMPRHANWQTAFFKTYEKFFADALAAEKWWALQLAKISSPVLEQMSLEESREELQKILEIPVQVRRHPGELAVRANAALQTCMGQWPDETQVPIVRDRVAALLVISPRLVPEVRQQALKYAEVLQQYLETLPKMRQRGRGEEFVISVARQLDLLDSERQSQLQARSE